MFLQLTGILVPAFAIIALGWGLRVSGMLGAEARQALGALVFWVCLPALLLADISGRDPRQVFDWRAAALGWGVFTVGFLLAMWGCRGLSPREQGSAVSGIGRFNGAFVGLPVLIMLVQPLPADQGQAIVTGYLVLLACIAPLTQALGLWGILAPLHGQGGSARRHVVQGLLINPLIWACVLGLLLAALAPGCLAGNPLGATLDILGDGSVPMALLCAGASIDLGLLRRRPGLLGIVCAARLLAFPALGYLGAWLCGLDAERTVQLVLLLACPTAASSVAIVHELGGDTELMAACVVATTLLAPVTMLVWLAVLPGLG